MNLQPYAAAVVAASGLAGLHLQARRTNLHAAEEIKRELDILALLPEGSQMREPLQKWIERSLEEYIHQKQRGRPWTSVALSLVLELAAAYFTVMAVRSGGWWWFGLAVAVPFALSGTLGLIFIIDDARHEANRRRRALKR